MGRELRACIHRWSRTYGLLAKRYFSTNSERCQLDRRSAATVGTLGRSLFWKLIRENIKLVDPRSFGKEISGSYFFHQRRGDLAVEMGLTPDLVVKRVKNSKTRRPFLNGKPRSRTRSSLMIGTAERRNSATSLSLPDFASRERKAQILSSPSPFFDRHLRYTSHVPRLPRGGNEQLADRTARKSQLTVSTRVSRACMNRCLIS
jgi:hypothetical protein